MTIRIKRVAPRHPPVSYVRLVQGHNKFVNIKRVCFETGEHPNDGRALRSTHCCVTYVFSGSLTCVCRVRDSPSPREKEAKKSFTTTATTTTVATNKKGPRSRFIPPTRHSTPRRTVRLARTLSTVRKPTWPRGAG